MTTDTVFAALADPTRRAILDLLRDHDTLTAASLVQAQVQGRENHYALDARPLRDVQREWLDAFAPHWQRSLERLKQEAERIDVSVRDG